MKFLSWIKNSLKTRIIAVDLTELSSEKCVWCIQQNRSKLTIIIEILFKIDSISSN